jgi:hypothetical protein
MGRITTVIHIFIFDSRVEFTHAFIMAYTEPRLWRYQTLEIPLFENSMHDIQILQYLTTL